MKAVIDDLPCIWLGEARLQSEGSRETSPGTGVSELLRMVWPYLPMRDGLIHQYAWLLALGTLRPGFCQDVGTPPPSGPTLWNSQSNMKVPLQLGGPQADMCLDFEVSFNIGKCAM